MNCCACSAWLVRLAGLAKRGATRGNARFLRTGVVSSFEMIGILEWRSEAGGAGEAQTAGAASAEAEATIAPAARAAGAELEAWGKRQQVQRQPSL